MALNPKYDRYQRGLANMVYNFLLRNRGVIATSKVGVNPNEVLAQELHKPAIRKFKKPNVYSRFKDNICAANFAKMGSLFSKNRSIKYLLCVIDVFTKYSLADKEVKIVCNGIIGIVNECKRKPNKLWVDQEREFYNNLKQRRLDIMMF